MDILVIGNGFDIEHGLPTKYGDFLDFMKGICILSKGAYVDNKMGFMSKLDKDILKHESNVKVKGFLYDDKFFDRTSLNQWKKEADSVELIKYCKNNIWLEYFIEKENYIVERWVDFESEISKIIQSLDYANELSIFYKNNNKKFGKDTLMKFEKYDEDKEKIVKEILNYLERKLGSYRTLNIYEICGDELKTIIKALNEDLLQLIRCLEIYLCDYVEKIKCAKSKYFEDDKYDVVLSFNYTQTFRKLYKIKRILGTTKINNPFDYIHGKADLKEHKYKNQNNMVLGIDEYLEGDDKNKKLDFIQFKKYFQRIFKRTGNEYMKWIKKMNNDMSSNTITIFGHSLDASDKDILRKLILESGYKNKEGSYDRNTQVIIYYYNEEVYAQQISNLVRIIGQDELIDRVYSENQSIIFKK